MFLSTNSSLRGSKGLPVMAKMYSPPHPNFDWAWQGILNWLRHTGRLGAFHLGSYLDILGLCSRFVLQKRVDSYVDACHFLSLSHRHHLSSWFVHMWHTVRLKTGLSWLCVCVPFAGLRLRMANVCLITLGLQKTSELNKSLTRKKIHTKTSVSLKCRPAHQCAYG